MEPSQDGVDQPVLRVEDPDPQYGAGHGGDHLGQVEHRAERALAVHGQVEEQCVAERSQQAERDHDHHQVKGVAERLAELGVVQELLVVAETDELRRADDVVIGEAVIKREGHRVEDQPDDADEPGADEEAAPTGFGAAVTSGAVCGPAVTGAPAARCVRLVLALGGPWPGASRDRTRLTLGTFGACDH